MLEGRGQPGRPALHFDLEALRFTILFHARSGHHPVHFSTQVLSSW